MHGSCIGVQAKADAIAVRGMYLEFCMLTILPWERSLQATLIYVSELEKYKLVACRSR